MKPKERRSLISAEAFGRTTSVVLWICGGVEVERSVCGLELGRTTTLEADEVSDAKSWHDEEVGCWERTLL